ncbi:unnamed protein product [Caenorhabditis auriculariae]|uniref:Uncharacterized protein n=1 Tax=Caenorhabditis auriculariae TaxID=2777116 RepID=A0A8S1HZ40_9PELO|nr:unnamed protein product [Caenorhabditis auriculariae]
MNERNKHSKDQSFVQKAAIKQKTDVSNALKCLLTIIATCNHSPKAQELLVAEVKATLVSASAPPLASVNDPPRPSTSAAVTVPAQTNSLPTCSWQEAPAGAQRVLAKKIYEICQLISMMCESCPTHSSNSSTINRNAPTNVPSNITKLFNKKKICNDLVKTISSLQFSSKDSAETVNQVLKTLDTLMKSAGYTTSSNAGGTTNADRTVGQIEVYNLRMTPFFPCVDCSLNDEINVEDGLDLFNRSEADVLQWLPPREEDDVEGSEIEDSSEESGSDETLTEEDDENAANNDVRDDAAETDNPEVDVVVIAAPVAAEDNQDEEMREEDDNAANASDDDDDDDDDDEDGDDDDESQDGRAEADNQIVDDEGDINNPEPDEDAAEGQNREDEDEEEEEEMDSYEGEDYDDVLDAYGP